MGRPFAHHDPLTEEQKQLAEDNIYVVWWFLKKCVSTRQIAPHEMDDCASYLFWTYCLSAKSFDPSYGKKFGNYAIKNLRGGLSHFIYHRESFTKRFTVTDFMKHEDGGEFSYEAIYEEAEKHVQWDDIKWLFDLIEMDPFEKEVIFLYYEQSHTLKGIGQMFGLTRERIRQIVKVVIEKLQDAVIEHDIHYSDCLPL
jgi:RNA polymerase sigma factor (sigma-70 family)